MRGIFSEDGQLDITGFQFEHLSFVASYIYLEEFAEIPGNRISYELGIEKMHFSISRLFRLVPKMKNAYRYISRAFLLYIQMISEPLRISKMSGRVRRIAQPIYDGVYVTYKLTPYDLSCENNWGRMSNTAHEQNNLTDTFVPATELEGDESVDGCLYLDNAGKIRGVLNRLKARDPADPPPGSSGKKSKHGVKGKKIPPFHQNL
ncbi:translation initiation factor IF-1, partial [Striga asiatica]